MKVVSYIQRPIIEERKDEGDERPYKWRAGTARYFVNEYGRVFGIITKRELPGDPLSDNKFCVVYLDPSTDTESGAWAQGHLLVPLGHFVTLRQAITGLEVHAGAMEQ